MLLRFFRTIFDLSEWMFRVVNQFGQMGARFDHNFLFTDG